MTNAAIISQFVSAHHMLDELDIQIGLFETILHIGPISDVRLTNDTLMESDTYQLKDLKYENITSIAEIERQFVFMFALSTYSRYSILIRII